MNDFGKTWWGEQFLNSLIDIDYSNRLPRGRTYARNGSVKEINIENNKVNAKVSGSRKLPYKIKISIPKFSSEQKNILIQSILFNPLLLARLLNRELPSELDIIAQQSKINIFPKSWEDFEMDCSCPDWAVPCKHLAAVIYIISSEIDKNPFIIFQLHDFDIINELEKTGFNISKELYIPEAAQLFIKKQIAKNAEVDKPYEPIDFSVIKPMQESLLSLLDKDSLFYNKDFKQLLKKNYQILSQYVKRELTENTVNQFSAFEFEKIENIEVLLHNEVFYLDTLFYYGNEEKHFSTQKGFIKLIEFIKRIPNKYVDRLSDALKTVYNSYHFSLKLLETSAYVPQIIKLSNGKYYIRWIPASINEDVEKIIEAISIKSPTGMVQMLEDSVEAKVLSKKNQVISLTSLFIEHFYYTYATSQFSIDKRYRTNYDKIEQLFFSNASHEFNDLGESETPGSIYQWLSRYYITDKEFVPLLKVEEIEDNTFSVELLVTNTKKSLEAPISFEDFLNNKKFKDVKGGVLQSLSNLAHDFKDMERYISGGGKEILTYTSNEFTEILLKILPIIKLSGIKILLPQVLKNLAKPRTSMLLQQKDSQASEKSYLNLDEMLNFEWQIAIGNQNIPVDEFKKLVEGLSGVVKIKGEYVLIDPNEIDKLLSNLSKEDQLSNNELLKTALTEEYQEAKITISPRARKLIKELLQSNKIETPTELKASLRPYQERGYQWLHNNSKIGFGSILADDMGLGKTIQIISFLLNLKAENKLVKSKALIIVPTTLISNWQKELQKFAPTISALIYHGQKRKLDYSNCDVLITSYGIIRSESNTFTKIKWAAVIIDEAQNIKNPTSEQTKSIKKLKSTIKIALSGTPVENRLSEYWSIFDFINKGYLGSLKYFKKEFSSPIESYNDSKQLEKLKTITSPFILRRLKTDKKIITDLPNKIENNQYISLTKEQTAIYQNVVNNMMAELNNFKGEKIKRAGLVFKLMTALKQICNHPSQFLKKEDYKPELSGKATLLLDILQTIYENNEKVLIFTQYKEMGDILKIMIKNHFGNQPLFLHGGTSRKLRDEMVMNFQEKTSHKTFILSIKAGGTGLNLTKANHVIHYDLWWNPAVEAQATDRAFRIGQQKNVIVYRMITKGTFEEKINEMIQQKKQLADLTVSAGEKWIGDLSNTELKKLINL